MVRRLLLLVFVVGWATVGQTQHPTYHQLTTEDGLPANEVYSIVQDAEGFVWIGCETGLYKYNGVSFKAYHNQNQKSRSLAQLTISGSGRLYAYTFSGQIFYLQQDSLYYLDAWQGDISNITATPAGQLFVSGTNGVFVYHETTNRIDTILYKPNFIYQARGASLDTAGNVWFVSLLDDKVGCYGVSGLKYFPIDADGESWSNMGTIVSAGTVGVWLVEPSSGNVHHLVGNRFVLYKSEVLRHALADRKCTQVTQQNDGKLWISTYSGMVVYNVVTDHVEIWYDGVPFSNILRDRERGIWLTSLHSGLFYIPNTDYRVWDTDYSTIPSNSIREILIADGEVYYGTLDGYLGRLDIATGKMESAFIGNRADVYALHLDMEGNLLANASNQLYSWKTSKRVEELTGKTPPIKAAVRVAGKTVYVSSFGTYLSEGVMNITPMEKILHVWSRDAVGLERAKQCWIATNEGIVRFGTERWEILDTIQPGKLVQALARVADTVYALLYNGEVWQYSEMGKGMLVCTLPNNASGMDIEVAHGIVYLATNSGLYGYWMGEKRWTVTNKTVGLASNDVKMLKLADDRIWLATGKGLQCLPLLTENKPVPPLNYLRKVLVNGQPADVSQSLAMDYKDVLGLVPEAAFYGAWGKYRFAYRVLETDTNWQYLPHSSEMILVPAIAPGVFTFELKVVDNTGQNTSETITLKGRVTPPYWQRWWFYLLIAVLVVVLAFIGFRYRLRSVEKRQREELERVQLQNELELSQQAALKAQMNPHFIFNVLNSIKSYIYENDKKSAAEYLSTFANLIRRILTMSGQPQVSLAEELDALELYLKLEAMLLEPPFEYAIHLDPLLDKNSVYLPSLLIQPFVENAFKHGLRHKHGHKQLTINISAPSHNHLLVSIDDNGVGRSMAATINKDRAPGHQSFATTTSNQRLELLNKNEADSINVLYEDKMDNLGKPGGTKVTLTIKLDGNRY